MLKFSGCPCLNSGRMIDGRGRRPRVGAAPPPPAGRPAGPGVQQRHAILSCRRGLTYRSVVPTSEGTPARASALQPTRSLATGTARSAAHFPTGSVGEGVKPTLRQACSRPKPRAQFAFKDSMIHIICNSHYVSHFAAFFIDTGAKISVVESCLRFEGCSVGVTGTAARLQMVSVKDRCRVCPSRSRGESSAPRRSGRSAPDDRASPHGRHRLTLPIGPKPDRPGTGARAGGGALGSPVGSTGRASSGTAPRTDAGRRVFAWKGVDRCNDPSAGSPTETLLRLLLPLGGRV